MKAVLRAALLAATALTAGCERAPTGDAAPQTLQSGVPAFALGDPRLAVAHEGVRLIEFTTGQGGSHSYRERIQTDGQGRFSLRPLELVDPGSFDWSGFELLQVTREGFLFRYRDFVIEDARLFARNWTLAERPGTEAVAGRTCRRYGVARRGGAGHTYELWVDAASGLVLASEQYDPNGQRVARMRYESVDYAPVLAGAVWHVPELQEDVLDPSLPLQDQVERRVLQPRLLPAGYAPIEAALIGEPSGKSWLRLTYGDGVESLFFLQGLAAPASGKFARAEAPSSPSRVPVATSSVVVFRIGSALAVQGLVDGFELMAIGSVAEPELLDLIESSLP